MDLKTLRAELQKLAALAEGWDASHEIADIERDLALGKLRELYDAVRFGLDSAVQPSVEDELSPVDLPPVEIDLDAVIPLTAMSEPFGADPAAAPLEEPTIAPPVVGVDCRRPVRGAVRRRSGGRAGRNAGRSSGGDACRDSGSCRNLCRPCGGAGGRTY